MKRLLVLVGLLISFCSLAQTYPFYGDINQGYLWDRGIFRKLHIPVGCGAPSIAPRQWAGSGAVYVDSCANIYYYYSGGTWRPITGTGSTTSQTSTNAKSDTVEMFRLNVAATTATNGWTKGTQYNSSSTETVVASGLRIINTHTGAISTNKVYNADWESVANDAVGFMEVQVTTIGGTNTKIGIVHEGATDLANIDNFGYVDLADDSVFIQTYTGVHAVGKLSSPIVAGNIVRVRFRRAYDVFTFTLENVSKALSAESFTYNEAGGTGTSTLTNIYAGLIVQDGTFIVRQFNYYAHNFRPDLMIIGDSRFNGQKLVTPYDSTFAGKFQHFSSWRIELAAKSANKIEDYLQSIKEIRNFESKYYLVDLLYNNLVTGGEDTTDAGPVYLALIDSIKNNGGHVIVTQTAPANNTAPTTIFAYIRDHFQNDPSVHILNLFNTTALYKSDTTNFYDNRYYVDGIHFNEDGQQEVFNYTRTKLESWIRSRPVGAGNEFVYNNGGQFGAASMVQTGGRIWAYPTSTSATPSARFHISSTVFMDSILHIRNNFSKIHLVTDANGFAYSLRIQNKNNGGAAGDGIRWFSHDSTKGLLLTWNNAATTAFNPSLLTGDFPLWFNSGGSVSRFANSLVTSPFIFGFSGTVASGEKVFFFHDSLFLRNAQSLTLSPTKYNSVLVFDSLALQYGHGRVGYVPLATLTGGGGGGTQGLQEVLDEDPVLTTSETITHAGLQISGTSDLELQSNTLLTLMGAGAEMRLRDSIELDWSGSTSKVLNLGPNLAKNQLANDSMLTYNPTTGRASYKAIPNANVTKVGTPADNQLGVWTGDGTIEGTANLTYNSSTLTVQPGSNNTNTIQVNNAAGTGMVKIGTYPGAPTYGGMWFGNTTPSSSNYGFLSDGAATFFNGPLLYFRIGDVNAMHVDASRRVGLGTASPGAMVHLGPGSASTGNGMLRYSSGTNLTTPVAGTVEYDGTSLFFSPSTTRLRHVLTDNTIPSNGQIPIGNGTNYANATITAGTGITITNGPGSITAAINSGYFVSSSYTPTLFNTTNISSSTANVTRYTRQGDDGTVYGVLTVTPTAELSDCELGFELPIPSDIGNAFEVGGTGALLVSLVSGNAVVIDGDVTNNRARFRFHAPSDGSAITLSFKFGFKITPL